MYTKFSKKLTFLTPWYANVRVLPSEEFDYTGIYYMFKQESANPNVGKHPEA